MNYLSGNENEFWNFIDKVAEKDKIALLTHNDLDGIASGIFLEEILGSKNIKVNLIRFLNYKKNLFDTLIPLLKKEKITKIFITDIGADSLEGFENFCEKFEVFLIDHHPINLQIKANKNILKTETSDCTALTIFDIGKNIINYNENIPLVCATLVSEMSFKKKENLDFIRKYYSDATKENIFESAPGMLSRKISSSLIYYSNNLKKIYDLIKEKNFKGLEKAEEIITNEISKHVEKFKQDSECYPEKKLCFYYFEPKYNIASIACTIVSSKEQEKTFIFLSPMKNSGIIKISARNQSGGKDVNILLKEATSNLRNALGGGHAKAAGGTIMKEDLGKFKKNILESM